MKQIKPIQIWTNGTLKTAEFLQVIGINDNYESAATNFWAVFTRIKDIDNKWVAGEQVAQGNTTITGQDYINWGDQPAMAINAWIYNWVASQINVVILP
jgi:hypothetical protein